MGYAFSLGIQIHLNSSHLDAYSNEHIQNKQMKTNNWLKYTMLAQFMPKNGLSLHTISGGNEDTRKTNKLNTG